MAARVDAILDALRAAGHDLVEATPPAGRRAAAPCTTPELLEFLRTAADRWAAGPYADLVGQERVVPYLFPTPAMTAGLPARPAVAIHADAGRFAYDTMTLVGPGHLGGGPRRRRLRDAGRRPWWPTGARLAYALCRPPGHHATPAGFGGSCYLNNAAVAAAALRPQGARTGRHRRHRRPPGQRHRRDLLRPRRRALRLGARRPGGRLVPARRGVRRRDGHRRRATGATRNLPLPEGTGDEPWLAAVAELAQWVTDAGCDRLVVSLGVDAAADDPESPLQVTADGYREAGRLLGATGLPAVAVQEGGYHLPTLGGLVAAYLDGHASA